MSDLPTGIVTFLFTDIQGSTRLLQELGPRYGDVQDLHQRIMRDAISAAAGAEIRTEGDSFFVVFQRPTQAVAAVVSAQRSLAAADWPHGQPLKVRMGMHTGEARLRDGDYLGIDVNRAARIAAAAHGGQVVISDATRALSENALPEGVVLRDLGRHRLKDLANPELLYDLVIEGLPSDFPALKSLEARPNNLPAELSTFIGRADDVETVVSLLRSHRLVTLTGPGGAGKTRLSVQVARSLLPEFTDGAFFVDLSPITEPDLVSSVLVQVLGLSEQANRGPVDSVRDHLRDRTVLLVMDNFEQVVKAAHVVGDLLEHAPRLHVLVTSRIPLHLSGEQEFAVPPMALPDPADLPDTDQLSQYEAVALFIDRARGVRSDFMVTNENAPAVAEICVRLDGLPLAIELAAVRVKLLSPDEILARLGHRLPLLTGGAMDVPERQRTLRNAIAWSHDLLEDTERRLFARLAAFSGGATIEAIEPVCNPDGELGVDTLDGVGSLLDKSLVRRTAADGETRFGMLETIREFAAGRLEEMNGDETRRRHARFFLALSEEAEPNLVGEDQGMWLDRLDREHDNIRSALRWAVDRRETEIAYRIGAALWRFWYPRGHLREGRRWLEEMLAIPGPRDVLRARVLTSAGGVAYWQADYEATRRFYEEALAISREVGDRKAELEGVYNLGFIPMVMGDPAGAVPWWEQSFSMAQELGDEVTMAKSASNIGFVSMMTDPMTALPLLEEASKLWKRLANKLELADTVVSLGMVHAKLTNLDEAVRHLKDGIRLLRDARNLPFMAVAFEALADVSSRRGQHKRAVRLSAAATALEEASGGRAPGVAIEVKDVVTPAREAIGDQAVDDALREGAQMDLDQAVAYALEEAQPG